MMTRNKILIALAAGTIALGAGIAYAQSEDGAVASAKAAGIVGEQADGYLGFAKSPSAEVRAAVDAVNIKRRQIYTEIAAKQGATVQEVAAARACEQIARRVAPGQAYMVGGAWKVRGSGPAELPSICG